MSERLSKRYLKTWTDVALVYVKADIAKQIKVAEKGLAALRKTESLLDAEHQRRRKAAQLEVNRG
jgi:hypothetical protein